MLRVETDINHGKYLEESEITLEKVDKNDIEITNEKISSYIGMGGAITEATAYNYSLLTKDNQTSLLDDLYSSSGLNYELGRVAIGSNDFALDYYSYASRKDLRDFSITRDQKYVIPMLKDIIEKKKISLVASPWSPPRMFKNIPAFRFGIKLKKKYYEAYSLYLQKWLDEYKKIGLDIKYLTMQNEPFAKQIWESCVFSLSEQKDFIYNYLLDKIGNTKILLWDHNKEDLYIVYKNLYENNTKVAGVGFHYYTGPYFENIKKIREENKDILLINTESCCGYSNYEEKNWISDAETYLFDII
jgi:glucosylceramidase